ncbi:hypothetical protein LCGC14_2133520, partial [marine sediment metagenome]
VSPDFGVEPEHTGLPASPGIISGRIVLSSKQAVEMAKIGSVILIRKITETKDIAGIDAAAGVITELGGVTCHAAVCARAVNTPCVVGVEGILMSVAMDKPVIVTIDGSTGKIWFDTDVPVHNTGANEAIETMLGWAFEAAEMTRQTDTLTGPRQYVMCGAWANKPGARTASLKTLCADETSMADVVFDLSSYGYCYHEEDDGLTTMFGLKPTSHGEVSMTCEVDMLLSVNGRGAMVYLPGDLRTRGPEFKQAGYRVVPEVETLADVFGADGMMTMTDENMKKVFGGYAALLRLLSMMEDAGTPMAMLEQPMNEDELAYKVFGVGY